MLKLEKLELKNGFTGTESLIKSGIALVADTSGTPVVASGNYMMHSSFGGVVAAINVSGDLSVETDVFASSANKLTVKLFAIATQKFAVEANAGKTTLKLDLKTDGKHLVVIKNTTGKDPAFASSNDTLELAEGATKGELVVEVKAQVAEGELEDTSISDGHKLSLTPGDVYMSMVARVADVPGNKENVTSFKLDGSSKLKLEKE